MDPVKGTCRVCKHTGADKVGNSNPRFPQTVTKCSKCGDGFVHGPGATPPYEKCWEYHKLHQVPGLDASGDAKQAKKRLEMAKGDLEDRVVQRGATTVGGLRAKADSDFDSDSDSDSEGAQASSPGALQISVPGSEEEPDFSDSGDDDPLVDMPE